MQPRWREGWLEDYDYCGGTSKLDALFHRCTSEELRIVWGPTLQEWHWATMKGGRLIIDISDQQHALSDPPTEEELVELQSYLELFAPDHMAKFRETHGEKV